MNAQLRGFDPVPQLEHLGLGRIELLLQIRRTGIRLFQLALQAGGGGLGLAHLISELLLLLPRASGCSSRIVEPRLQLRGARFCILDVLLQPGGRGVCVCHLGLQPSGRGLGGVELLLEIAGAGLGCVQLSLKIELLPFPLLELFLRLRIRKPRLARLIPKDNCRDDRGDGHDPQEDRDCRASGGAAG